MDYIISFTPAQLIGVILAICAGITCVSGAITVIISIVKKTKEPEEKILARITALEDEVAKYKVTLNADSTRLHDIEDGFKVTQKALLALLDHGIDGNAIESMKSAKKELQDFLISK